MKRILLHQVILLIFVVLTADGQQLRSRALGGLSLALVGEEYALDLYTFGQNPAWLVPSRTRDYLDILPFVDASWGEYRRLYDPREAEVYGVGFDGVKPLGEAGTFRGYTSYTVDQRHGVYRSLKWCPYNGEAFFVTDSTTGNFTYNGPAVGFNYSYKLMPTVFLGVGITYQVLDGLKDVYTRAKTLCRHVGGTLGVAWEIDQNVVIGATGRLVDWQERIESQSENLLDVEVFRYRGETYATHRSGGTLEEKVRTGSKALGIQIDWRLDPDLEVALIGDREVSVVDDLNHLGTDYDSPEGFTSFEHTRATLRGQYRISEGLMAGVSIRYGAHRIWSKQPTLDLLLWDSKFKETAVGAGIAWRMSPAVPLLGLEYEFLLQSADSAKYIDNRFANLTPQRHRVSLGAELDVVPDVLLRAGYCLELVSHDLISGGRKIVGQTLTVGAEAQVTQTSSVQALFGFDTVKEGSSIGRARSGFFALAKLRLLAF